MEEQGNLEKFWLVYRVLNIILPLRFLLHVFLPKKSFLGM